MSKYRPQVDWDEDEWLSGCGGGEHGHKHMKLHDKRRDSSKHDNIRNRRRASEARKSSAEIDDSSTRVYRSPGR